MEPSTKEEATAVWFVQFPEDPTVPTTPLKTTIWQKFSLLIIGAWQFIIRAWVSCHASWSTWDPLGSESRISIQAAWFRARILTSLRELASILIQLKSWLRVQATWDRLRVPPALRGWGLMTEVYAMGSRGLGWGLSMRWSRHMFGWMSSAGMALFIYHFLLSTDSSLDTDILPWMHQRYRYQIVVSASMALPLPYPVDDAAHTAILSHIGWTETEPLLSNLSSEVSYVRSNVSGILERGEEIGRYLALNNGITNLSFCNDIEDLLNRFHSTATPIKVSVEFYDHLEVLYRQQQNIAGENFERCRSYLGRSWHETLIRYQPSALKFFGIDFNRWYGVPLQDASRIWEEVLLGVAALHHESQRMKRIEYLITEEGRILDKLATLEHNQCNTTSKQERLRQHFEQALVRMAHLDEIMDNISALITDEKPSSR